MIIVNNVVKRTGSNISKHFDYFLEKQAQLFQSIRGQYSTLMLNDYNPYPDFPYSFKPASILLAMEIDPVVLWLDSIITINNPNKLDEIEKLIVLNKNLILEGMYPFKEWCIYPELSFNNNEFSEVKDVNAAVVGTSDKTLVNDWLNLRQFMIGPWELNQHITVGNKSAFVKGHRHDQSILRYLTIKNKIYTIPENRYIMDWTNEDKTAPYNRDCIFLSSRDPDFKR